MKYLNRLYNWIRKISGNQKILYIIFVCILMFTNCVLFFTEPMSVAARFAYLSIPLGVQMWLMALVKRPGKMFLFLLVKSILDAFQLVLIKLFGGSIIAVDMFINLISTSATEAGELLSNLWPVILLLLIIYIPAIILSIRSVKNPLPLQEDFRRKMFKIAAIVFLIGLAGIAGAKFSKKGFRLKDDLYPVNVLYNLKFAIQKTHRVLEYPRTCENFTYGARKVRIPDSGQTDGREIYVLILGETARAESWSIYGYERNTTPNLDTLSDIVVFKDALTQSNTTHKSLSLILSPAEAADYDIVYRTKSIITAFKEAGFKTVFITNQNYNKSFTHYFAQEADLLYSLSEKEGEKKSDDHQMLPYLDRALQQEEGDLFIIIHLYGSHFNYHERYTDRFRKFVPDKAPEIALKYFTELVNSFDNTILSTDDLIAQIIRKIDSTKAGSAVMYISDHGEDLMDDKRERFLHASPIPTFYQLHVPYLIWFSEKYKNIYPDKFRTAVAHAQEPVSSNSVFPTLLDIASVSTPYLDSALSVVSDRFKAVPRTYLTDRDGCSRIDELHLNNLDITEFKKKGLRYP